MPAIRAVATTSPFGRLPSMIASRDGARRVELGLQQVAQRRRQLVVAIGRVGERRLARQRVEGLVADLQDHCPGGQPVFPEAVTNVLQEAESRRSDLARLPHIPVKGDLPRDALRITRRQDWAGIDAARVRPEEAAVLTEELTQQRVWTSGQVTDSANPDSFQPDGRGRPTAREHPQWQW